MAPKLRTSGHGGLEQEEAEGLRGFKGRTLDVEEGEERVGEDFVGDVFEGHCRGGRERPCQTCSCLHFARDVIGNSTRSLGFSG